MLRDSLTKLGYTVNKFTAGAAHGTLPTVVNRDGWIGVLAANPVLVIPPLRRSGLEVKLPPLSKEAIREHVTHGGGLIICGTAGGAQGENATRFLNALFEYGLSDYRSPYLIEIVIRES